MITSKTLTVLIYPSKSSFSNDILTKASIRTISVNTAINKSLRGSTPRSRRTAVASLRDSSRGRNAQALQHSKPSQDGFISHGIVESVGNEPFARANVIAKRKETARPDQLKDRSKSTQSKAGRFKDDNKPTDAETYGFPYASAKSQLIFGYSAVYAALCASKRKFYRLYLTDRALDRSDDRGERSSSRIRDLAKGKVAIRHLSGHAAGLIDKLSAGTHNGIVLEASPLPIPSIQALSRIRDLQALGDREGTLPLGTVNMETSERPLLSSQSSDSDRYPLVLLLDGISDQGNIGAILRSAYFFQADAITLPSQVARAISPTTVKTSGGATEGLTLLDIGNSTSDFVSKSKENGWRVYAAVAPRTQRGSDSTLYKSTDSIGRPLAANPCILVVGSEHHGIDKRLLSMADVHVAIESSTENDLLGIDSLNVSAATAILLNAFTARRLERQGSTTHSARLF